MRKYLYRKTSKSLSNSLGFMWMILCHSRWLIKNTSPSKYPIEYIKYKFGEFKTKLLFRKMKNILKGYRDQDLIAKQDWEKLELKRQKILNGTWTQKEARKK